MTIESKQLRDVTVLSVTGLSTLSRSNVRQFESQILDGARGATRVVLDASSVEFFDSDGMDALLALRDRLERRAGVFALSGLNSGILEVFKLTGLDCALKIYPDVEKALLEIAGPPNENETWH
jgi:anti-sigma B factor antagonist